MVIQTAFLGDVVLATGILEKLHEYYPQTELHYLVRKGNHLVLEGHPFIKKVWLLDKNNKLYSIRALIREIRKEKFDLVVNLQRFFTSGLITALSAAKTKIGFEKNPLSFLFNSTAKHEIGSGTHEIERNNNLIKHLTGTRAAKPRLYPTQDHYNSIAKYVQNKPYICVAPASVWFTKQFPTEKWVEFLNKINKPLHVYFLGGPKDAGLGNEIILSTSNSNLKMEVVAGKLSPLESVALMKGALMNYVNDSGPMHFASAVDAPVTAIFCSTVPEFGFGPLSSNSNVAETKIELYCRPCGLHGYKKCPEGHFKCALTIDVEKLLKRL